MDKVSLEQWINFYSKIIKAFQYIDSLGYAYRDFNKGNLMTQKNENNEIVGLKIIDFGMTSPL